MLGKEDIIFLGRWIRTPLRIGAVAPSGAALGRLVAKQVDRTRTGPVVELGSGTGSITTALLKAGITPERLILFERDHELCQWLKSRFGQLTVFQDDARNLRARLAEHGIGWVDAIVSGLPLLSMAEATRHAVVDQALSLLGPEGVYVQFSYSPLCPIPRQIVARHGLEAEPAGVAWRNFPPATIWRAARSGGSRNGSKITYPFKSRPNR